MTKTRLFPLLIAALGFAQPPARSSQAPSNPAAVSRYFPLAVGNRWTFTLQEPARPTSRLTWEIKQKEASRAGEVFYVWATPASSDEPLTLEVTHDGIRESGTNRYILKGEMKNGDRWQSMSTSLRVADKRDLFEVLSVGSPCAVKARRFKDCVMVRELDYANSAFTVTTYARGVGPVSIKYYSDAKQTHVIGTQQLVGIKINEHPRER